MRPPLSAIEPLMLSVSIGTRSPLCLSAASRVSARAAGALWPGTGGGTLCAPGAGAVDVWCLALILRLRLRRLLRAVPVSCGAKK